MGAQVGIPVGRQQRLCTARDRADHEAIVDDQKRAAGVWRQPRRCTDDGADVAAPAAIIRAFRPRAPGRVAAKLQNRSFGPARDGCDMNSSRSRGELPRHHPHRPPPAAASARFIFCVDARWPRHATAPPDLNKASVLPFRPLMQVAAWRID